MNHEMVGSTSELDNEAESEKKTRRLMQKIGGLANRIVAGAKEFTSGLGILNKIREGVGGGKEVDEASRLHEMRLRRIEGIRTRTLKDADEETLAYFRSDTEFFNSDEYKNFLEEEKQIRLDHPEIFGTEEGLKELRKKHFEWAAHGADFTRDEKLIMHADDGWDESPEFKMAALLIMDKQKSKVREMHAEIFQNVSSEEIEKLQSGYLEKLKGVDWVNVLASYGEGKRFADEQCAVLLCETLGINNPPTIVYKEKGPMDPSGCYVLSSNEITIFDGGEDVDSIQMRGENDPFFKLISRVNLLSHEMWHAYQHQLADSGNNRGELYEMNFKYYLDSNIDMGGYKEQLVEKEAYAFGDATGNMVYDNIIFDNWNEWAKKLNQIKGGE